MKLIPIKPQAGISKFESPAASYIELPLSLDEILVLHPSATFLAIAEGNSMEQCGIFNGDLLVIDRHVERQSGDVIVANLNGEFVCKILDSHRRLLISANPEHSPVTIGDEDVFTIEGVVIRAVRCFRPIGQLL